MFRFEIKKPHIFLVGTGGTGGFALESITRLLAGADTPIAIDIYDGDTVEAKNLKRQNFTVDDLDKPKAQALADRLSNIVLSPPRINVHNEYITDANEFLSDVVSVLEPDETAVFISALDNIESRRLFNEVIGFFSDISLDAIAIDSGNSDIGGQVVLYSNNTVRIEHFPNTEDDYDAKLPSMLELYPEIDVIQDDNDRNPAFVTNCAEEAESKPQAMLANKRNADIIALIVGKLYANQAFSGNVWTSSIVDGTTNCSLNVQH